MSPETKSRSGIAFWLYVSAFAISAVSFIFKDYQNDTHGMIFSGFTGMYWYACASRERDAK